MTGPVVSTELCVRGSFLEFWSAQFWEVVNVKPRERVIVKPKDREDVHPSAKDVFLMWGHEVNVQAVFLLRSAGLPVK